jgi:predicted transcriptional regulator
MSGEEGDHDGDAGLAASDIHDVLRNDRRRLVLERLRSGDGTSTVSELAEHIGGVESGESPPPRNVRQSVYVSLHQTHLPKLDELGIVEYDSDAKTVSLADNAADVGVYMEVVPEYGISWAEYYLGVGLLGLLSIVGAVVGVPVLRAIGPTGIGLGLSVLVLTSSLYRLFEQESTLWDRLRGD